ncbi:MAG TPA: hypothetical protein VGP84_07190, partial [Gemmatimonadaceae bacterium]|nr:hypothetical protein [Gemmatimonadaceae bacterium]
MAKLLQALVAVVFVASSVRAQDDVRSKIREIFHFGTCSSLICLSTSTGNHGTHYNPDAEAVGQVV